MEKTCSNTPASLTASAISEVYSKPFRIRYSDIDLHGVLKTVKIFDYFQDIASEHAARMGISGYDVLLKNLAWVVYRYQLTIDKLPAWNETIEISTFRNSYKKLYEIRSFKGMDANGHPLFEGKAAWILVDVDKHKPVRLDKHLPQLLTGHESSLSTTYDFAELDALSRVDQEAFFNVGMMDLDINQHVNNSVYVAWAIEALPEEILFTSGIRTIDIKFIAEALYKDRIVSQIERIDGAPSPSFLHKIMRERDNAELARLKSVWRHPSV